MAHPDARNAHPLSIRQALPADATEAPRRGQPMSSPRRQAHIYGFEIVASNSSPL